LFYNRGMEFFLKLTLAVHKVTELFPAGEQLKDQIRELADKVLADFLLKHEQRGLRQIQELVGLLDLAEAKNWVDPRNFEVLRLEYGKIEIEKPVQAVSGRKEKILKTINSNGKTKLGDLVRVFPDVNRRTLLRDLGEFTKIGLLVRNGNGRGAHYVANVTNVANVAKNATLPEKCDIV